MSKVSILTAVYNDERHLRKCLDSLCGQTLRDIQMICIDDCSTDSSLAILREYAAKDPRIVVLEQPENRGQAVARNRGIEIADGQYITMLDSDDWLAPDALEKACRSLEEHPECDCALFRLMLCYPQPDEEHLSIEHYQNRTTHRILAGRDAFMLSLDQSLHGVYLARAELFKQYPYDDSCRLYSDDNSTSIHYLHSRYVVLTEGQYFYLKHPDSSTIRSSMLRFDFMYANLSMKRMLEAEAKAGMLGSKSDQRLVLDFYESHRWLVVVGTYYFYYLHKQDFTEEQHQVIQQRFTDILQTIEANRISWNLRIKPGYTPVKHWWLFKLQEEIYFYFKQKFSPSAQY